MHINPINANPPPAVLTPPNYMTIEQGLWQANARQVRQDLNNRNANLLQRIQNYGYRFNHTQASIETEIHSSRKFAATFAKSPSRTDFDKEEAYNWLGTNLGYHINKLPKRNPGVLYVAENGDITTILQGALKPSRALNFSWQERGLTFYAMHKYTRDSGGAQGNQFREAARMLENFNNPANPANIDNVLIVITDGNYYTNPRMNELRNLANSTRPRSFAVHIQHVPWAVAQCP